MFPIPSSKNMSSRSSLIPSCLITSGSTKTCWLNGDFQPRIVEQAVVVVPSIFDLSVYAFRAFDRTLRVINTCEERDGSFLVLPWPRVTIANWWRRN
ncbi:hypothetical protein DY000_02053137 [Brassica cretica]|uniref:Uncharacterized protein n=1 Tax=Brassica cretica TaxID=69181 RepID=A0ABQ7A5A3_BRACR|nr:hypothetical protein DY000_02053137 [Brassica cretica]